MKYCMMALGLVCSMNVMAEQIIVSELCEHIYQRKYFVSRLSRPMHILYKLRNVTLLFPFEGNEFQHPIIKQSIEDINTSKSILPLFDVWQYLMGYKNIHDEQLMREFTGLILMLPSHLMQTGKSFKEKELDVYIAQHGTIYTEALSIRRYYAHRLQKALAYLKKIKCKKSDFFETNSPKCDCVFVSNYNFTQSDIKECIKKMNKKNSLKPIIRLSNDFAKLKLIHDALFQKEFMIFIFTVYRNLIVNNAVRYNIPLKKSTLDTIAFLYDHVNEIPLEQILDTVDLLVEDLAPLLAKYELNSPIPWKEWIKKYWWLPPTTIVVVGLHIVHALYHKRKLPLSQGQRLLKGRRNQKVPKVPIS